MTHRFKTFGKEVLLDGRHFADGADEEAARWIETSMNAMANSNPLFSMFYGDGTDCVGGLLSKVEK